MAAGWAVPTRAGRVLNRLYPPAGKRYARSRFRGGQPPFPTLKLYFTCPHDGWWGRYDGPYREATATTTRPRVPAACHVAIPRP